MANQNISRVILTLFVTGALLGLAGGAFLGGDRVPSAPTDSTSPAGAAAAPTGPMTSARAAAMGANELGRILVLEYHQIGAPEADWTRTPEQFRADIDLLKSEGFYPIDVRDLATGNIEVAAGKTPVVLTFDDSSPGQYRILDDQTIDPDSAVGIMEAAVRSGGWASRASFYVLLDVRPDDHVLFGQPDYQTKKLRSLVEWGYEVGSHTVSHLNLKEAYAEESTKQLALSAKMIEDMVGSGYKVQTLSIPLGEYPADDAILRSGTWESIAYGYIAALKVSGGASPSPFSQEFDPLHIPRVIVRGNALREAIQAFKDEPGLRYVSDGDPAAVSVPAETAEALGTLRADLGRPVITY
ncbi:MAG TPA: polysaccharide deacetylase family protein [Thermoleophilia bacterium]|nr:polysaccharide deacetylase family protein [Thermoleophilia bacterium]